MLTKEAIVPYDRTLLSKALPGLETGKAPSLRPVPFLEQASIDVRTDSSVSKVDGARKTVTLDSGETVRFDKLCIATGGKAIVPEVDGVGLKGVFTLRTKKDQEAIRDLAQSAKSVTVIGGSWIATEVAAALIGKYKDQLKVNLVCSASVPFEGTLGKEVG